MSDQIIESSKKKAKLEKREVTISIPEKLDELESLFKGENSLDKLILILDFFIIEEITDKEGYSKWVVKNIEVPLIDKKIPHLVIDILPPISSEAASRFRKVAKAIGRLVGNFEKIELNDHNDYSDHFWGFSINYNFSFMSTILSSPNLKHFVVSKCRVSIIQFLQIVEIIFNMKYKRLCSLDFSRLEIVPAITSGELTLPLLPDNQKLPLLLNLSFPSCDLPFFGQKFFEISKEVTKRGQETLNSYKLVHMAYKFSPESSLSEHNIPKDMFKLIISFSFPFTLKDE